MQDLCGKVAVVTGAGSGLGQEIALACAREGMRLVLADINRAALDDTVRRLAGAEQVCCMCDVADAASVEALAVTAWQQWGGVHLLFNNAGVLSAGPVWSMTVEDWKWIFDVNVMGVVHGIRSFVPRMRAAGQPAHVVNTASLAGLMTMPGSSAYCASKHAVVAISECLAGELRDEGSSIGVSVLCPAFVPTRIADAQRYRPAVALGDDPLTVAYREQTGRAVQSGRISAAEVADMTLAAVKSGEFYIITHPKSRAAIAARHAAMLGPASS